MATDFSRVRDNPLLNYAAVELKQGGVLLDADANELAAIVDRRLRALASDVLGRATVGANTPDAFRITAAGGGLEIGPGRLYVDGLLAENHGFPDATQRVFDDLLAETRFTAGVPYGKQPYFPDPPPLPQSGVHLVYLDVWDREVTHLEESALVEPAVGVETSSRLQTVWQVRVLDGDAGSGVTCGSPDSDFPGWSNLTAPSGGRLTTGTYQVSASSDPCELPPTGGYRGLENQLYRVEIHDAGPPGTATFKWSRENASVGSRVTTIVSATTLELQSLGRDDVLRFNTGDWVEILDDVREFSQLAGEIRKVTVEEATRRISFSPALPAAMLPAVFPDEKFAKARNLRVRRWDQQGQVLSATGSGATAVQQDLDAAGSTGLIQVPPAGTTLLLENGVTVGFTVTGSGEFRAGDYWVFAARTADASVELLDAEPPRGIHHHYARLGVWDVGSGGDPTDCRHFWPPAGGTDCGCTRCVTPESHASGKLTLQDAVQQVQAAGGTVCLQPGQYVLRTPVNISAARSVRIRGQGPATVIVSSGGAFNIAGSVAIVIENLAIVSAGNQTIIGVQTVAGMALQNLVVLSARPAPATVAVRPGPPVAAIALSGLVAGLAIRDNLIIAPEGVRALDAASKDAARFLVTVDLGIENNILWCEQQAIDMSGLVLHFLAVRLCANEVLGCRAAGISVLGFAPPGTQVDVTDNSMSVAGPGIRCGVDGSRIEGNKLNCAPQTDRPTGSGISLLTGLDPNGSDQCHLLANQVSNFPDSGILISAPVTDLICKLNIITGCGSGITMIDAASAGSLSIENNHLRDIGGAGAGPKSTITGITVVRTRDATVAGNILRRIGVDAAPGTAVVAGIAHFSVARTRIADNQIMEVGPPTALAGARLAGILLLAPYAENLISGNHIVRDAQPGAEPDAAQWSAVEADEPNVRRPVIVVGGYLTARLSDVSTLVINGSRASIGQAALNFDPGGARIVAGSSAALRGNVLAGRGSAPVVSVSVAADIQFCDNRCDLQTFKGSAVVLSSTAAIVSSNLVRGGQASLVLTVPLPRVAVLGNATTSPIAVNQASLSSTPWGPLNVSI